MFYILIVLLFFVPILLRKHIGILQIAFAVFWLIVLHAPFDADSNLMDNLLRALPFWLMGSLFAINANQRKRNN